MRSYSVAEAPISVLREYGCIAMSFEVRSVFDSDLKEHAVDTPYVKDYGGPADWRFDMSKWGVIVARADETSALLGGAVIAFDTPDVHMLESRRDLAVLWDLRVAPEHRGKGIGSAIFEAVEAWAAAHGCLDLKIETQNTNVPACRFYQKHGCELRHINAMANEEMQLLWYKRLP